MNFHPFRWILRIRFWSIKQGINPLDSFLGYDKSISCDTLPNSSVSPDASSEPLLSYYLSNPVTGEHILQEQPQVTVRNWKSVTAMHCSFKLIHLLVILLCHLSNPFLYLSSINWYLILGVSLRHTHPVKAFFTFSFSGEPVPSMYFLNSSGATSKSVLV